MEKKEIRKQVYAARKSADSALLKENSEIICKKIIELPAFQKADTIFVYMDCKGEVGLKTLLEEAWKQGKKTAAPRVTGPGEMKYYYITSYEDVAPGYYDIPEPVTEIEAEEEDALLIVPGVGFDVNRHRCGYGQGFYDRYLSQHQEHTTIAVAFEFQIVDEVPVNEFDIFPEMLITEKRSFGTIIPKKEPERQYYFIEKCREIVNKISDELGRPLTASTVTFGCPSVSADKTLQEEHKHASTGDIVTILDTFEPYLVLTSHIEPRYIEAYDHGEITISEMLESGTGYIDAVGMDGIVRRFQYYEYTALKQNDTLNIFKEYIMNKWKCENIEYEVGIQLKKNK